MSRRNGRYRAAVGYGLAGLILIAAIWYVGTMVPFDLPRFAEYQDIEAPTSDYRPNQGKCDPQRLSAAANTLAGADQAAECAKEAEDYRLDKEGFAQAYRSTNAAEEALRLSFQQTRIVFMQAILSVFAVFFTGWAAWAASRAARAAQDSVEDARADAGEQADRFSRQLAIAKESADAAAEGARHMSAVAEGMAASVDAMKERTAQQMRAYVAVVTGRALYQEKKKGLRFEVSPVLINTGYTPARKVTFRADIRVLSREVLDTFDYPLSAEFEGGATLNPQQTLIIKRVLSEFVPEARVAKIKSADGYVLLTWGVVSYEDIFGETHSTQFSQVTAWNGDQIVGLYTAPHNDSD